MPAPLSLDLACSDRKYAVNQPDVPKRVLRTHLFILRLWRESLGDGRFEWRGRVQHVFGGERHSFRDWSSLVDYLERRLDELDAEDSAE